MSICLKCHRTIKDPIRWGGYGPVCAKAVQPAPEVECDLFGYDIDAAALAAREHLAGFIETRAWLARDAIRAAFRNARERLEVTL